MQGDEQHFNEVLRQADDNSMPSSTDDEEENENEDENENENENGNANGNENGNGNGEEVVVEAYPNTITMEELKGIIIRALPGADTGAEHGLLLLALWRAMNFDDDACKPTPSAPPGTSWACRAAGMCRGISTTRGSATSSPS